jgi:tetratricopeptide (TPR) repeat protein
MPFTSPTSSLMSVVARSAVLGVVILATTVSASAEQPRYFDPVLDGSLCLPSGDSQRLLLAYYQKIATATYQQLAQATETKPFPPRPAGSTPPGASADAPIYDDLGVLSFPITTKSPTAQRYFDQGLRLAYGFNHAEAGRAFRTAQKQDPDCAMCAWGEALVLGPNINAPMEPDAVAPAMAAMSKAKANASSVSPREQALIAALAERYSADPKAERKQLDAAYAAAMERVATQYGEDNDTQVLYAESLMDLSPWDYWEANGARPKGKTADIVAALEKVLGRKADHPGAIHYYIHMMEASASPERALPYAQHLAATMPGAGHLVHMPFHIYYRVGDYRAAVAANKAAVEIDEAYIAREKPVGIYPLAYYPHNVHSLMASAQMAGDGASAVGAAEKLAGIVTADAARAFPMAQPVAVAHYYAHAQFSSPATILALAAPPDDLPFVKAMWHYARGVAYAADKNAPAALKEAAAIEQLRASGDFSALTTAGIPAPDVLDLARQVVLGRIALAEGRLPGARDAFERAAEIQDRLIYSEPPFWYYPVRQSLAAVLLQSGELNAAEDAFRASLAKAPNNGWALFGLAEVYRRMGRADALAEVTRRLDAAWAGDRSALDVARL